MFSTFFGARYLKFDEEFQFASSGAGGNGLFELADTRDRSDVVDSSLMVGQLRLFQVAVKHRQAAVETSRLIRMKPRAPGVGFGQ